MGGMGGLLEGLVYLHISYRKVLTSTIRILMALNWLLLTSGKGEITLRFLNLMIGNRISHLLLIPLTELWGNRFSFAFLGHGLIFRDSNGNLSGLLL
jgi:hypothetical protein